MEENNKSPIKSWAEDDRPREKLLLKGRTALSDAELIAILIGSGTREESAVDVSKRILKTAGNNLYQLGKLSVKDLMKFKGIGEAKAITIVAAMELGRRRKEVEPVKKPKIASSSDVFELMAPELSDLTYEEFWTVYLNRANKVIHKTSMSRGGVSGTVVDIKMIMKNAIENLASGIILCHNHPSGNLTPSQADKDITKKLKQAAELLEIPVLDHLIIADKQYFSFADEGLL